MPRLPRLPGSSSTSRRKIPWLTLLAIGRQVVTRARHGWEALTPAERERLAHIVRTGRGGPAAVPADDRRELRRLVAKALKASARVV
jgi:hypothetical protein